MQEPYTIKVGEGITQDITLDDNVTTISLDDEKLVMPANYCLLKL